MSKIFEYSSYEDYLKSQIETTNAKYGKIVYIQKNIVNGIYEYFKNDNIKNILCHGTRSGEEQKLFKDSFKCYVMGSELCSKAVFEPMTTIWDFNKVNSDWIGKFDLVYTNSFDHTITPKETLEVWKNQLAENGKLLIQWSDSINGQGVIASDPLNATAKEIISWASDIGLELVTKILEKQTRHGGTILVFKNVKDY